MFAYNVLYFLVRNIILSLVMTQCTDSEILICRHLSSQQVKYRLLFVKHKQKNGWQLRIRTRTDCYNLSLRCPPAVQTRGMRRESTGSTCFNTSRIYYWYSVVIFLIIFTTARALLLHGIFSFNLRVRHIGFKIRKLAILGLPLFCI